VGIDKGDIYPRERGTGLNEDWQTSIVRFLFVVIGL